MDDNGNEGQYQGLTDLINQTAYQPIPDAYGVTAGAEGAGVQGGVDRTASGEGQEGSSPAVSNVPGNPSDVQNGSGVTPQPQDASHGEHLSEPAYTQQPDPRLTQMQETIQNQARYIQMHQQQIAADRDRLFQESLQDMSEGERRAAIAEREAQRLRVQNQRLMSDSQKARGAQQDSAKRTLALLIATEAGLDPTLSSYLLSAQTPQEMEDSARFLASRIAPPQQEQQPQQQQEQPTQAAQQEPNTPNPNAFVAGGENVSSNVAKEIEAGSGDLMGLIAQTQYQVAGQSF